MVFLQETRGYFSHDRQELRDLEDGRKKIIILVLHSPAQELGKELMLAGGGAVLPISQAAVVKGCVGTSKAALSPSPQPPPARWATLAQAGKQRKTKMQEKA